MRMKRLWLYLVSATALSAFVACSQDVEEVDALSPVPVTGKYTLVTSIASVNEPASRTQLTDSDGALYAMWSADDRIAVVCDEGDALAEYTLANGVGGLKASFVGELPPAYVADADYFAAVYPYESALCRIESDRTLLGAAVPEVQEYVAGSFAQKAMPMAAFWKQGDEEILFKPMAAAIRLNVYADQPTVLTDVRIEAVPTAADEAAAECSIAGENLLKIDEILYDTYADPVVDYALIEGQGAFAVVPAQAGTKAVDLQGPIELSVDPEQPTPIYVVVAPACYPDGFTVTLTSDQQEVMVTEARDPFVVKQPVGGVEKPVLLPGDILDMPALKFETKSEPEPVALKLKPTFYADGSPLFFYSTEPEFAEDDRMGVFINGQNIPADYLLEEGSVYFVTEPVVAPAGTEIICYFPYSDEAILTPEGDSGDPQIVAGTVRVPVAFAQTQLHPGIPAAHQFTMCGNTAYDYTVTVGEPNVPIDVPMNAKSLATWKFSVSNWNTDAQDEMLQSLTLTMGDGVYFGGEMLFNNASGNNTFTPALTEATVTLREPVKLGFAEAHELYIVGGTMSRGTYWNTGGFTLTLTTDKAVYTIYTIEDTKGVPMYRQSISLGGSNLLGVNIDPDTPSTARLVGQPFTVGEVLYDFMDRPSDGTIYGWMSYERESYPWDVVGYEITALDPSVVRYWVYSDLLTNWEALDDAAILAECVEKGVENTAPAIVNVEARENGPSNYATAVAVVVEYDSGLRELFKTHRIATQRGYANFIVWE